MHPVRYRRLRINRRIIDRLKKAAAVISAHPDAADLLSVLRLLVMHIQHFNKIVASSVVSPAGIGRASRLDALARFTLDQGVFTPESLQSAFASLADSSILPSEITGFPIRFAAVQCDRLDDVLKGILQDKKERAALPRFANRLRRSRHPTILLNRAKLHPAAIADLLTLLQSGTDTKLLHMVETWLEHHGSAHDKVNAQASAQQDRFAAELHKAEECFSFLSQLDWLPICEAIDPIHQLLLADPAGIYQKMTQSSRLELRLNIERISRSAYLKPETILKHALSLSRRSENNALEAYIGYWFQDAAGLRRLRLSLSSRAARLRLLFTQQDGTWYYPLLLFFSLLCGFIFLEARQPVFMLPFFSLTVGSLIRALLARLPRPRLPQMQIDEIPGDLRILVILPAVLSNTDDAMHLVRRIKAMRHAFPDSGVDFLLAGDFADSMTIASSTDAAIIQVAAAGIAELADSRCIYLQRGRTWDRKHHICSAPGGRRGAFTDICRLIVQGESKNVIVYASMSPAAFERRYAYVFVLPPDQSPAPGCLKTLLQYISHPMCSRYPEDKGWRGYAVLSPTSDRLFEGLGLIQPGPYLEATDGLVYPHMEAAALCGELAGHTSVQATNPENACGNDSWHGIFQTARRAWQLAPWQLPWVQTPSGFIRNPLKHPSRFRLREQLRDTLVPLGQLTLLLWATATKNWMLLVLALFAPELQRIPRTASAWLALLRRLALLPTRTFLPLWAIIDLVRQKSSSVSFAALEVWAQGIAATVMTALGIAFPGTALPSLSIGALFASFPLIHKYTDAPLQHPPHAAK